MKLAIFDIDGTLTDTSKVDADCFVQAFRDTLDVDILNGNWEAYTNYTDSGLAHDIIHRAFGRPPEPSELSNVIDTFMVLLRKAYLSEPDLFREIPGAANILDTLRNLPDWRVAIATGCWEASARMKLECAKIDADGVPLAHSDHLMEREKIVLTVLQQAKKQYRAERFEKIVYVGDGIWDVKTTRKLGFHFVGIGTGEAAAKLRAAGARTVLPDYGDAQAFLRALEASQPPQDSVADTEKNA